MRNHYRVKTTQVPTSVSTLGDAADQVYAKEFATEVPTSVSTLGDATDKLGYH